MTSYTCIYCFNVWVSIHAIKYGHMQDPMNQNFDSHTPLMHVPKPIPCALLLGIDW